MQIDALKLCLKAESETSDLNPKCLQSPPLSQVSFASRATASAVFLSGNAFVVSLALADLLVAVYPYPLVLSAIFHDGWIAGYVHCQVRGIIKEVFSMSSEYDSS